MLRLSSIAFVLALGSLAARADVWVVAGSGGHFTSIQPAVDAAQDGDVIVVMPGSYAGFTISVKSLTVVGVSSPSIAGTISIQSTSPGQPVVLAGLGGAAWSVQGCQGSVRAQACGFHGAFTGGKGGAAGVIDGSDDVVVSGCQLTGGNGGIVFVPSNTDLAWGGGHGMLIQGSSVALFGTTSRSGAPAHSTTTGLLDGRDGGSGVELRGSYLFASGSTLIGGRGATHAPPSCQLWYGYGDCGDGGHGLWLTQAASIVRAQSLGLVAGAAGTSTCQYYWDGLPGKILRRQSPGSSLGRFAGPPRTIGMPSLLAGVSSTQVTFTGAPGDVVHLATDGSSGFVDDATLHGVWTLAYPPQPGAPLGVIDASGTYGQTVAFPPLQPGEPHRTVFVQPYVVDVYGQAFAGMPWSVTLVP